MNNENNNNNNQNNNYVKPQNVDLSNVNIDKSNENALNRERDNIIKASVQVNNSVNETQAKIVNNTIKVKKRNPIVSFLIGAFFITIAGVLAYFGFRLLRTYITYDDAKHTTTTTTTQKVNYFANYTYDTTKLRRFQNDSSILFIMPSGTSSKARYIYVEYSSDGSLKEESGTYNIKDRTITLVSDNATQKIYDIESSNLKSGDTYLNMSDQEYKYYSNKSGDTESILIVNASVNKTFAYFYDTNNNIFTNFKETTSSIDLENGMLFTKSGNDLIYNGLTYNYIQ